MRSDPLRLCSHGHSAFFHVEAACPYCAALQAVAALTAQVAQLQVDLAERTRELQELDRTARELLDEARAQVQALSLKKES